nr:uncharacterized protein LOC111752442 [Loxodonta africana]
MAKNMDKQRSKKLLCLVVNNEELPFSGSGWQRASSGDRMRREGYTGANWQGLSCQVRRRPPLPRTAALASSSAQRTEDTAGHSAFQMRKPDPRRCGHVPRPSPSGNGGFGLQQALPGSSGSARGPSPGQARGLKTRQRRERRPGRTGTQPPYGRGSAGLAHGPPHRACARLTSTPRLRSATITGGPTSAPSVLVLVREPLSEQPLLLTAHGVASLCRLVWRRTLC